MDAVGKFCTTKRGEYNALLAQKADKEKTVMELEKEIADISLCRKVIEEASKEAREQGCQFVEMMCSDAVGQVYGPDVSVKIVTSETSQGSSAELKIATKDENGNIQVTSPSLEGGGMNDIIATVMQVLYGNMVSDNYAPIVLDEPSKYVSKGLAPNFAKFLKDMSLYSSKQLIIPTHDDALMQEGDTIHFIKKDDTTKTSSVTKIV